MSEDFEEDWERKAREQALKAESAKRAAEEKRRRVVLSFRKVANSVAGKEALEYLRTQICGAHLYPVFDDPRKEHFFMARRWVWGQVEALLNAEEKELKD